MTHIPTSPCQTHRWERCLETHEGVECVVRVCAQCGRRELCWSRRGYSAQRAADVAGRESKPQLR